MPTGVYPRRLRSVADRFWDRVQKGERCWWWMGARNAQGYGRMTAGRRGGWLRVHRVSWEIAFGPIPDGLWVLHRCDNPSCVRPDHLWLGTRADNMRDCREKGRTNTAPARAARAEKRRLEREYLARVEDEAEGLFV